MPKATTMVALPPNPKPVTGVKDLAPCPYHGDEHMVEATIHPSNCSEWLPVYVCMACYHDPSSQDGVWIQQPESTFIRLIELKGKDERYIAN